MILILHGWGQEKASWQELAQKLRVTEPTEILELPSFGQEPQVDASWGVPEYTAWVKQKILDQRWDNIILLGHSFGGRLSSYVASDQPTWLRAVILYGAPCLYRPQWDIRWKILLAKILKPLIPKSFRNNLLPEHLRQAEALGLGKTFRHVVGFDQTDRLPRISVPTLLLWGARDYDVPLSIAREMQHLISGAKLEILPDLGHNAHLENPFLFYGKIKSFVENL